MRPFYFPLQKILDYRMQLEDQAKMELAKAQQAYQRQVQLVEEMRQKLSEHEGRLYSGESLSTAEMWLWRNYKERLLLDVQQGEQHMLELARALNQRRREAVVRAKDRKLLEKLKTNQMIRHADDEKLREQKEFDEMATLRYEPQTL